MAINPGIFKSLLGAKNGAAKGTGALNALSLLSNVADRPNDQGRTSVFGSTLKTASTGAQLGMQVGGPLGAGIGAGLGAIGGFFMGKDAKYKEEQAETRLQNTQYQAAKDKGAAYAGANPEEIFGNKNAGYFKRGGKLSSYGQVPLPTRGEIKQLGNGATITGPSHEQGGVDIGPSEVEGEETMAQTDDGTYVMTKMGGIANTHKQILRSVSKIQRKPMSPERVNALNRLKNRENLLINFQQSLNGNA